MNYFMLVFLLLLMANFVYSDVEVQLSGDSWMEDFAWNILGYGVIILPAMFIIRVVRKSNFYEQSGEGLVFKLIKCCVFGDEKDISLASASSSFRCFSFNSNALKLAFCVIGLQASYLTWGVLQEKVMTNKYGEGVTARHFKNSQFLVFANRVMSLFVASVYMLLHGANWSGPFYRFSYSSLSNICSSWCQYEALKFVSYPTQVLGKTCKVVPVMIMGKFVSRKTYEYYEYIVAVTISIGVSMFLLGATSDKRPSAETTLSGLVLMFGYMMFDSFTSNWQSSLFTEYKVSSMQMMFNVNCFSFLFTITPLILSGGMIYSLQFLYEYRDFCFHVFIISLTSATGQLFIFYTIAEFGPLVFTTAMVTRQMISILLSCIIYGHNLSLNALLGVVIVFFALFLQIYGKYRTKQAKKPSKPLLPSSREDGDMA